MMLCIGDLFAQQQIKVKEEPMYHYYANGSVSVKITPWVDHRRTIILFDLEGNETFTTEEVHMSYSVHNRLKFHENGAVKEMVESTNPGASMYMCTATMTFSTINEPLKMIKSKSPSSLEDMIEETIPWFWNKKSKSWFKQESIECQPVKPYTDKAPLEHD